MDWKKYEQEIADEFRNNYPNSKITVDCKLFGKFSKIDRQIDLLIEEQASDFAFRIIVDAKFRGRKLDVSDVEAFLGLVRDVDAHTGVMVSLEGYTAAAMNRSYYDDCDVLLDVLNFEELKAFQGQAAFPYSGENGVGIAAPFGWIVDGTRREGAIACLYQRGRTLEEAQQEFEWMYVNFWTKDEKVANIEALVKHQEQYLTHKFPDAEFSYLEGCRSQKVGAQTFIRCFRTARYPGPEYTGFVEFDKFIAMFVMFTPEQLVQKNLRKLRFLLRDAFPVAIRQSTAQ